MKYETIKQLAKDTGVKITDLIALAPQNDCFYVGTKGDIQKAEWVANIYEELGSPREVHIRRIHYFLVSREDILKPDRSKYENTENDWNYLVQATKSARYLGAVPIENFADRRNPPPTLNARYWANDIDEIGKFNADELATTATDDIYPYNLQHALAYHIELWAEKSTVNDILLPLANGYRANVVTGLGELSITSVYKLMERVRQADKPVRIFYISDFDPAGETMPISVARKIEYFARQSEITPDIKLRPILLTKEQCVEYALPRTPIKASDKRKTAFEMRHGEGATELDALEALHSGEMTKILRKAIEPYIDKEALRAVSDENERIRETVTEALKEKLKGVFDDFTWIDDNNDFEMPAPKEIVETNEWLFDSSRTYTEQLRRFKDKKGEKIED